MRIKLLVDTSSFHIRNQKMKKRTICFLVFVCVFFFWWWASPFHLLCVPQLISCQGNFRFNLLFKVMNHTSDSKPILVEKKS